MRSQPTSPWTLCALAAIGFVVACVAHEAAGHGLTCLGSGGTVRWLTSVYFRCQPGRPIVDAAGPLANLCMAAVCILAARRRRADMVRLTLALIAAFNGLWGSGYLLFSAVTDNGDFAFVVRDLALHPAWAWRLGMGLTGAWLYLQVLRAIAPWLPKGRPLLAAYASAGAVACVSVLFYAGPLLPALREAAQEGLLAPIGLAIIALSRRSRAPLPLPSSRATIVVALLVVVTFWITLGRGYGGV